MSDPMSERYKLSDEELEHLRRNTNAVPVNDFKPVEAINPLDASDIHMHADIDEALYRKTRRMCCALAGTMAFGEPRNLKGGSSFLKME